MTQLDRLHKEICSISNEYQSRFDKPERNGPIINFRRSRFRSIPVFQIRTSGCNWHNSGSGCFMCFAYNQAFKKQKIDTTNGIIKQFDILENNCDLNQHNTLFIYPSNFFDNAEVSLEARKHLYNMLNKYRNLKNIFFQTRPELVSPENLNEIKEYLPDKNIILRLGIETSNDFIRKYCVNKSFSFDFVKKKAKLIHNFGLQTSAFLLIKPPFLTEKEAIDDALTSIRDCLRIGIKYPVLMPVGVFRPSLVGLLYHLKMYRPAWIWSIIHIIEECRKKGWPEGILLSDLSEGRDRLISRPKNCPQCTEKLYAMIKEYHTSNDIKVFDKIKCECESEWKASINQINIPLKKRIVKEYKQLITLYKQQYQT